MLVSDQRSSDLHMYTTTCVPNFQIYIYISQAQIHIGDTSYSISLSTTSYRNIQNHLFFCKGFLYDEISSIFFYIYHIFISHFICWWTSSLVQILCYRDYKVKINTVFSRTQSPLHICVKYVLEHAHILLYLAQLPFAPEHREKYIHVSFTIQGCVVRNVSPSSFIFVWTRDLCNLDRSITIPSLLTASRCGKHEIFMWPVMAAHPHPVG